MKPLDLDQLERALRAALAEQDWARLTALDMQLSTWLSDKPVIDERDSLERVRAAYRDILTACAVAGAELEQRLVLFGREREGQLAYAQARQWEEA